MIETKNAKIESISLGFKAKPCFDCLIELSYGGASCQGFGGYAFDTWDAQANKRLPAGPYGLRFIQRIMEVVGVEEWSDLKGKLCRVKADYSKVHAIGNILEDKWFSPLGEITELNRDIVPKERA